MVNVVPKDSRYVPLSQQKYCCVPTCIQMVMLRHNIPLISAELLGYQMGLVVPSEARKYFWNARTAKRPPAGYGTQVGKPHYGPNLVFRKLKIPLKMTWSLIDRFKTLESFKEYLGEVERRGQDVLLCYDWPSLFDPKNTERWGHVCVLDRVFIEKNELRMIDPSPDCPKWQTVEIDKMYDAMKFHGKEKSGGFWELEVI